MLRNFILIGAGGALGSMMRYGINLLSGRWGHTSFPFATFSINMLGCLLIGLFYGLAQRQGWLQEPLWLFLATGICGGFTTFSAFALEGIVLMGKGENMSAMLYTVLSVVFGLLLCRAGIWLSDVI